MSTGHIDKLQVGNLRRSRRILLVHLCMTGLLVASSGASCNRQWLRPFAETGPVAPALLETGAPVDQIAKAINENTARVQSLVAAAATITIPGATLPSLRGKLALERPQRFRLTAGLGLTGQEVDVGSNDELFWMWIRRNQPPGVYTCRHDQFAGSAAHQVMPIEPSWLLSSLGLVELDPALVYEGPLPRGDGHVELRTYFPSSAGNLHRVLVIDAQRAWVTEQHVYDTTGTTLLASAVAHSHRFYPVQQVSLPDHVTIRLPPTGMALSLEMGDVQLNQLTSDSTQLWTLPPFVGYQHYDLGTAPADMQLPGIGLLQSPAPMSVPAAEPATDFAEKRGFRPWQLLTRGNRGVARRGWFPLLGRRQPAASGATTTAEVQPASYQRASVANRRAAAPTAR